MTNYFIFNGENSLDYGIKVPELPPISRAPRRATKITIPGRSGTYTYNEKNGDEDIFEAYFKSWEIVIKDVQNIEKALTWLSGSGEIIFSNELNKAYIADFSDQIALERVFKLWRRGTISCEVQPFKRDLLPTEIAISSSGTGTRFFVETQRKIPLYIRLQISNTENQTYITLNDEATVISAFTTIQEEHPWITIDGERQTAIFDDGRDAGLAISGTFPLKLINGYNQMFLRNTIDAKVIYRGVYL